MVEALPCMTNSRRVLFLDNTDPDGFDGVLKDIHPKQTLVAVVSKSGGTKETRNAMMEVQALYERHGVQFTNHAVALTVEGSQLDQRAIQEGWLSRLRMGRWSNVGHWSGGFITIDVLRAGRVSRRSQMYG